MFINGIEITSEQQLESVIADMSEDNKTYFRNMFNNTPNIYTPSQAELDKIKYLKRAASLSQIIAEMAVENVERVRSGLWTVEQLTGLTQDLQLKEILTDLYSLSFEIAYTKIDGISNILITQDIKNNWKAKLYSNF